MLNIATKNMMFVQYILKSYQNLDKLVASQLNKQLFSDIVATFNMVLILSLCQGKSLVLAEM